MFGEVKKSCIFAMSTTQNKATMKSITTLLVTLAKAQNRTRPYGYEIDKVCTSIETKGYGFAYGHTITKENGVYIAK